MGRNIAESSKEFELFFTFFDYFVDFTNCNNFATILLGSDGDKYVTRTGKLFNPLKILNLQESSWKNGDIMEK